MWLRRTATLASSSRRAVSPGVSRSSGTFLMRHSFSAPSTSPDAARKISPMPPRANGFNSAYLPNIRGNRWLLMHPRPGSGDCSMPDCPDPEKALVGGGQIGHTGVEHVLGDGEVVRQGEVGVEADAGAVEVAVVVGPAAVVVRALAVGAAGVGAGRLVDVEAA